MVSVAKLIFFNLIYSSEKFLIIVLIDTFVREFFVTNNTFFKFSISLIDSNCNGIYGRNSSSGLTWEEELCDESSPKGLIYLGRLFYIPTY